MIQRVQEDEGSSRDRSDWGGDESAKTQRQHPYVCVVPCLGASLRRVSVCPFACLLVAAFIGGGACLPQSYRRSPMI